MKRPKNQNEEDETFIGLLNGSTDIQESLKSIKRQRKLSTLLFLICFILSLVNGLFLKTNQSFLLLTLTVFLGLLMIESNSRFRSLIIIKHIKDNEKNV